MVTRHYQDLEKYCKPGKVLVIYGPRRVGKTTLLETFLAQTKLKTKRDTGEHIRTQEIMGSNDLNRILEYAAGYELLAIDEAQNIPNVGQGLKLLIDHRPDLTVVVTGSSSFGLAQKIGEPLVGRKRTLLLYPLAEMELLSLHNPFESKELLPERLVFGSYPEVVFAATRAEKIIVLQEIVESYLLKDIFILDRVRNPAVLHRLLQLLAFQVGNEVSINELAINLAVNQRTVLRYVDLLEKAFVIKSLGALSRNRRNEVVSKQKYYFLDVGIRNALISSFNPLDVRDDVGRLWENYVVVERLKKQAYQPLYANNYFWRTYDQQEVDWVEERDGGYFGFEFKWGKKDVRPPKDWLGAYPQATFERIGQDNFLPFIT